MQINQITPTVFYRNIAGSLHRAVDITLSSAAPPGADLIGSYTLRAQIGTLVGEWSLRHLSEDVWQAFVPDVRKTVTATFSIEDEGAVVATATCDWKPGKHWHVVMVPVAHHDYGYTGTIDQVLDDYRQFYRDVLEHCRATDSLPEHERFHYTAEQAWSIVDFLRVAEPGEGAELINRIREGRVEVPALFGNEITHLCDHEGILRLMYPSFDLHRRYGAPITTAAITDVPGLAWGLASALAGAGVRWFLAGLPTYFEWGEHKVRSFWDEATVMPQGRPGAFMWQGPDGNAVLTYYHGGYGIWTPSSIADVTSELPGMLGPLDERTDYPFDTIRGAFNGLDNRPPDAACSTIANEWNAQWEYPKLIVGTNTTFFERLQQSVDDGAEIPTLRGDLPDTDYALGALSSAYETGINRLTHSRLCSAERWAAIASTLVGTPDHSDELHRAWEEMLLFDEHTWGMSTPVGRTQEWNWATKSGHAHTAAGIARNVESRSLVSLANSITPNDEARCVVVFNSTSSVCTGVVEVELFPIDTRYDNGNSAELSEVLAGPVEITDAETGEVLPHQIVHLDESSGLDPDAAGRHALSSIRDTFGTSIHVLARDVPAAGWRTLHITPIQKCSSGDVVAVSGTVVESPYYRAEIDASTGALGSLIDLESGVELVDVNAPHGLNQFLARDAVTGETESPGNVELVPGESGEVFGSIVVRSCVSGCPQVEQEVRLFRDVKRVAFATRVVADGSVFSEHYVAFPFDVPDPRFRFDAANAVIEPLADQVPGSNTEAYSVQRWADVCGTDGGIILSGREPHMMMPGGLNPVTVSQAHHGKTPDDYAQPFGTEPPTIGHIYSPVMLTNFRTNFRPRQPGEALFRYSLTSYRGTFQVDRARDFGSAVHYPCNAMVANTTVGDESATALPLSRGFCEVTPASVSITAVKTAERGDGLVIRLFNSDSTAVTASLDLPLIDIDAVYRTDCTERFPLPLESRAHTVSVEMTPFEVVTLLIERR
jgi:alpha-mannosidase